MYLHAKDHGVDLSLGEKSHSGWSIPVVYFLLLPFLLVSFFDFVSVVLFTVPSVFYLTPIVFFITIYIISFGATSGFVAITTPGVIEIL